MASQPRLIACGTRKAVLAMAMKFLVGPFLMAVPSIPLELRGTLLKVAIVQVNNSRKEWFLLHVTLV